MNTRKMITGIVLAATAASALPVAAEAHDHGYYRHPHYRHGYHEADYRRSCRTSGTTGMIVGGAAGALVGRQLAGGDRTTGTILGAGAGALLGREVGKRSNC